MGFLLQRKAILVVFVTLSFSLGTIGAVSISEFHSDPDASPYYLLDKDVLVLDMPKLDVVESSTLIHILDEQQQVLWTKWLSWPLTSVQLPNPSSTLPGSDQYTFVLVSSTTGVPIFRSEPFSFWPECERPTNIYWDDLDVESIQLNWQDPNPQHSEGFQIRLSGIYETVQTSIIDCGKGTYYRFEKDRVESLRGITIRKICRYQNGVLLYSDWVQVPLPDPGITSRSVDCSSLSYSFAVSDITEDGATVTISGPAPGFYSNGPWYRARYKVQGSDYWSEITWQDSSHVRVIPLQSGTIYDVSVQASFGSSRFDIDDFCENMPPDVTIQTLGDTTFQDIFCGTTPDTAIVNGTPYTGLEEDDVILVYGFPVIVKQRTHQGNGVYNGSGTMAIPFGSKRMGVEFTSILVNTNFIVESGDIKVKNDANARARMQNLMNQPAPVTFSCVPPSVDPYAFDPITGLNSFGFDSSGYYSKIPPYPGWEEGMPFDSFLDPNGFDANGIHTLTGTIYNPNGCSQAGVDSLGNPCNPKASPPYYWLIPSGGNPTDEGVKFWSTHKPQVDSAIIWGIQQFDLLNDSLITVYRGNCGNIRESMEDIVVAKGLDTVFLFGQNGEYFQEGLHQHFIREPQKYSNFSGRDEQIMALEQHHFDLYHCDKYLNVLLNMEHMIDSIMELIETNQTQGLVPFRDYIEPYIMAMDSAELAEHIGTPEKLLLYLKELVIAKLVEDFQSLFGEYVVDTYHDYNVHLANQYHRSTQPELVQNLFPSGVGCSTGPDWLDQLFEQAKPFTPESDSDIDQKINYLKKTGIKAGFMPVSGGNEVFGQPLELNREIGSLTYTIFLDSIIVNSQGATLDAWFILEVQSGKRILFGAEDIAFNPGGLEVPGKITLLNNSPAIPLGKAMRLTLIGENGNTYVNWGCSGFEGLSVEADIEFCREYLTPLDSTTLEPMSDGYVTASIVGEFDSWSDILVQIDVDPFAITNKEEYKFRLDNVWLDFSDNSNPEGVVYPEGYDHPMMGETTWQGVYFEELSVTMPKDMASKDEGSLTIGLQNFVFDDYGASGSVHAGNILPLSKGSCAGWGFSIDTLAINILENRFYKGLMHGYIHVPLFKSVDNTSDTLKPMDCFGYTAFMDSYGRYQFDLEVNSALRAPALYADVTLNPNTSITMTDKGDGFEIYATLNGEISIHTEGNDALGIDSIIFSQVVLSNKGQAIRNIGYWSFPLKGIEYSGFELNFNQIGLREAPGNPGKVEAVFLTNLGLTTSGVDLKVDFDFGIQGKLDTSTIHHKWVYDKFNFYQITIEGSCTGVDYIKGSLIKYQNDTQYGTGFQGAVAVKFAKFDGAVQAMGIFGKHNEGYKYGMVDVMVTIPGGIPFYPPLVLNGFGGGFWYNMQPGGHDNVQLSSAISQDSVTTDMIKNRGLGVSLSGVTYIPYETSWGLKLTIAFVTQGDPDAVSGNATFEMNIFGTSGFSLAIIGNLQCMSGLDLDASSANKGTEDPKVDGYCSNAPIRAYFKLEFASNLGDVTFDAEFKAFISIGDVIEGIGDGGKLCDVKIHIGPKDWYFWLGEPNDPGGMRVSIIPGIDVEFTTYFNLGSKLPDPAKLDSTLARFFEVPPSFTLDSKMAKGGGFMHGSKFKIGSDTTKLWIFTFYANLTVGYDLAMMKYDAICKHSYDKPGINGWYATGQLYVYLAAHLGYKFKFLFKERKGTIAGIEAGVLLRAQLPNPVWAQGVVKASYNILGIIKGSARFSVEFGTQCEFLNPDSTAYVVDMKLFDYMDPPHGSQSVSTNVRPVVHMNYPIDKPFEHDDGNGNISSYVVKLERIEFISSAGNEKYSLSKDSDGYGISIRFKEYLRPDFSYLVKAYAYLEVDGEIQDRDTLISRFVTGALPETIEPGNVEESFPHVGQHYFLPGDADAKHGYVKLACGQYYLFSTIPLNARSIYRLKNGEEVITEGPVFYDCQNNQVNFEVDWSGVDPETEYKIDILHGFKVEEPPEPPIFGGEGNSGFAGNGISRELINPVVVSWPPGVPGGSINPFIHCMSNPNYDDTLKTERVLFSIPFRTSAHDTWTEKMEAMAGLISLGSNIPGDPVIYNMGGFEGFDDYEIFGHNGLAPFFTWKLIDETSTSWLSPYRYFISRRSPDKFNWENGLTLNVSFFSSEIDDYYGECVFFDLNDSIDIHQDDGMNQRYAGLVLINSIPEYLQEDLPLMNDVLEIKFDSLNTNDPGCLDEYYPADNYSHGQPYNELPSCLNGYLGNGDGQALYNLIRSPASISVQVNSDTKVRFWYSPKQKTNKGFGSFDVTLPWQN